MDLNNCSQWNLALPGEPFNCQIPLARMMYSGQLYAAQRHLHPLSAVCLQPEQQTLVSSQLPLGVMGQIRSGCHRFVVPVPLQPGLAAAFSSASRLKLSEAPECLRSRMANGAQWLSRASILLGAWAFVWSLVTPGQTSLRKYSIDKTQFC